MLVDFGIAREQAPGRRRDPGDRHAALHGAGGAGRRGGLRPQRRLRPRRDRLGAADREAAVLRRSDAAGRDGRRRLAASSSARCAPRLQIRPERRLASVGGAGRRRSGAPLGARRGPLARAQRRAPGGAERAARGDRPHDGRRLRGAPRPRSRWSTRATGELVYQAAWGAGAEEVVGVRLARGQGLPGSVVESGEGRGDPRLPQRPALRRERRQEDRLRPPHDARLAARSAAAT